MFWGDPEGAGTQATSYSPTLHCTIRVKVNILPKHAGFLNFESYIWNDSRINIFTKPLLRDFVLLNQNQGFSKIVISEIF